MKIVITSIRKDGVRVGSAVVTTEPYMVNLESVMIHIEGEWEVDLNRVIPIGGIPEQQLAAVMDAVTVAMRPYGWTFSKSDAYIKYTSLFRED